MRFIQSQPKISRKQARWLGLIGEFGSNLTVEHRPGRINPADPLSRNPKFVVLNHIFSIQSADELLHLFQNGYSRDPEFLAAPDTEKCALPNGLVTHLPSGKIWVPNEGDLRLLLLKAHHDEPLSGHFGIEKTLNSLQRHFWWPRMRLEVVDHIKGCYQCQRNKSNNQAPAGKIQPIPIPPHRWESISLDFIGPLPITTNGFDYICVVVERCTKFAHFIPCSISIDATQLASILFREVFRLHGLPLTIISDRDPRFLSKFWTSLQKALGTELRFSTAYHPETDGQTERLNRTLEDSLRAYCADKQSNWDQFLYLVEFAYNSSKHSTTGYSPFFLNYGFHPRGPPQLLTLSEDNPTLGEFLHSIISALASSRMWYKEKQISMETQVNKHRRELQFKEGDFVMLSTKNLRSKTWLSKKLTPRFIGPFEVEKRLNYSTYQLKLPSRMKCHPRFHVSLLRPYLLRGESMPTPIAPVIQDDEVIYLPEAIQNHRFSSNGQRQFLVKWVNLPVHETSWVFETDMDDYANLIRSYLNQRRTNHRDDDFTGEG